MVKLATSSESRRSTVLNVLHFLSIKSTTGGCYPHLMDEENREKSHNEFKISPKLVFMLHTLAVVSAFAWGQLLPSLQLILLDFKTNDQLEKKAG